MVTSPPAEAASKMATESVSASSSPDAASESIVVIVLTWQAVEEYADARGRPCVPEPAGSCANARGPRLESAGTGPVQHVPS